jgi:pimeloyl-ACP methyl ester carboxylesterase
MAKLMSKKTKETVQTIAVLAIVILLIIFYIIYPLITVTKMTARPDREKFDDSKYKPINDPAYFVQAGLHPDTFSVINNDNITLAGLFFSSDLIGNQPKGTVILLHPDDTNSTFMFELISPLIDSGYNVVLYDQRANGFSGGIYHSAGILEADDLMEVIVYLNLHGKLTAPMIAAGFESGADACLIASQNEKRIAGIVAINPFLTVNKWLSSVKDKKGGITIPFYKMTYFWWYQKLSGYPIERTGLDDIPPITTKTILVADQDEINNEEIRKLAEISSSNLLHISPISNHTDLLKSEALKAIFTLSY